MTGSLVAAGLAYPFGFYLFALVAVIGFLAVASIPKPKATTAAALAELEHEREPAPAPVD